MQMDYELKHRFNKFWNEWEHQKQHMLSQIKSNITDQTDREIAAIEKQLEAECQSHREAASTTIKCLEAMHHDLSQSFDRWCEEVSLLVERMKQEEKALVSAAENTMSLLQRERDNIEKTQGEELMQLHQTVMKIIADASAKIDEKFSWKNVKR